LGERLLCKQEVDGSIPFTSTTAPLRRERPGAESAGGGSRGVRTPLAPLDTNAALFGGSGEEARFAVELCARRPLIFDSVKRE
jgi:hypothetical protein